jgi:hypothetical protein
MHQSLVANFQYPYSEAGDSVRIHMRPDRYSGRAVTTQALDVGGAHSAALGFEERAREPCSRTVDRIAELLYGWCAQQMEDAMCYAKDYRFFDDQKKAEDTQVVQERRAGLIARLLNAANKHGEKTEAENTPVKEVAPAK